MGLSISLQSLIAAWNAPIAAPPNSNVSAPIYNIDAVQTINGIGIMSLIGGLALDSLIAANYLLVDPANNTLVVNSANHRVGVGTTNPKDKLGVSFNNDDEIVMFSPGDNRLAIQTALDGQPLINYGGNENRLILQPIVGVVGIGTTNPRNDILWPSALDVNGQIRGARYYDDDINYFADLNAGGNLGGNWNFSGLIHSTGDICTDQGGGKCLSNQASGVGPVVYSCPTILLGCGTNWDACVGQLQLAPQCQYCVPGFGTFIADCTPVGHLAP